MCNRIKRNNRVRNEYYIYDLYEFMNFCKKINFF